VRLGADLAVRRGLSQARRARSWCSSSSPTDRVQEARSKQRALAAAVQEAERKERAAAAAVAEARERRRAATAGVGAARARQRAATAGVEQGRHDAARATGPARPVRRRQRPRAGGGGRGGGALSWMSSIAGSRRRSTVRHQPEHRRGRVRAAGPAGLRPRRQPRLVRDGELPETFLASIRPGMDADVYLVSYPGRRFRGSSRGSAGPSTRTTAPP
jgi:multidrug efflux system membrane fusion protein